jgi:hypothetical protein
VSYCFPVYDIALGHLWNESVNAKVILKHRKLQGMALDEKIKIVGSKFSITSGLRRIP